MRRSATVVLVSLMYTHSYAQAHPGPPFAGEADVGHLCGGEHPMVVEEAAELTVPFGEPTDHGEQSSVEVTPATTRGRRGSGHPLHGKSEVYACVGRAESSL